MARSRHGMIRRPDNFLRKTLISPHEIVRLTPDDATDKGLEIIRGGGERAPCRRSERCECRPQRKYPETSRDLARRSRCCQDTGDSWGRTPQEAIAISQSDPP